MQVLVDHPAAQVQLLPFPQPDGRHVGQALGARVAGLIERQRAGRGAARLVQGVGQRQRARQVLVDHIDAEIEARLDIRAEAIAEVGIELLVLAALVLAIAVGAIDAQVGEEIQGAELARHLRAGAGGAEAAALEPQLVRRRRGQRGGRGEIDRAAQRGAAIGQAVAALVHLGGLQRERIDLIEVAAAVGEVGRHAVLQHVDAADVIAARDAGAANRQPQLLAIALLYVDARRVLQDIAHIAGIAVRMGLRIDEADRADGAEQRGALPDHGRHRRRARNGRRDGRGGQRDGAVGRPLSGAAGGAAGGAVGGTVSGPVGRLRQQRECPRQRRCRQRRGNSMGCAVARGRSRARRSGAGHEVLTEWRVADAKPVRDDIPPRAGALCDTVPHHG
ncbi:hypothetical protein OJJOAM_001520 [Cupriavidus sp. H18C1]